MKPGRFAPTLLALAALVPAACAAPAAPSHRYFRATADQIGPYANSYGEAVIPRHGLIVVQGDDLAYGLARTRSHHEINGADRGQASITISETLRKVVKGVQVENRGFPGDTAAAGRARWSGRPAGSLLILLYGQGDMHAHSPQADFGAAMAAMVKDAHAQGAAVFIVLPPPSSDPLTASELAPYRAIAGAVATGNGVEIFDVGAAMARILSPPLKTVAQRAAVYQAVAADMVPYIKVVDAAAPSPQTGQAGSGESRTVRVSAAKAS